MFDERLMDYFELVREFSKYEYELKFDVPEGKQVFDFLKPNQRKWDRFSVNFSLPDAYEKIEGSYEWGSHNSYKIKNVHKESLISHYCGGMVVVQRIGKHGCTLYSNDEALFEIKVKGEQIPVKYGFSGEEWVIKREEKVKNASLSEILRKLTEHGLNFEGSVQKNIEYNYVKDLKSRRVFELSYAQLFSESSSLLGAQLEVEYVGIEKDEKPKKSNERMIISDLIELGNSLVGVNPTRKNKRDFISR